MNCYVPQREMTAYELLDADPLLNSHYGRHPKVLSNVLQRYYKQGLLYRNQSPRRGRVFYYGITEKGFERLLWLLSNRRWYFFQDRDFLEQLSIQILHFLEKRKSANDERRRRTIRELEELVHER